MIHTKTRTKRTEARRIREIYFLLSSSAQYGDTANMDSPATEEVLSRIRDSLEHEGHGAYVFVVLGASVSTVSCLLNVGNLVRDNLV